MSIELKTNTAAVIVVGPFLDATDGKTPETALTATNEHGTLVVDNPAGSPTLALDADLTASGGNNDFVHVTGDDAGYYTLELTAAQLNYLGPAKLSINYVTDHLPVFHEINILTADEYESKYGSGATTQDVYDRIGAPAGASIAADLVTIDNFVDDLESRVIGTIAAGTHNPQSGDSYAIVNSGTYGNAALDTELGTLGTEVGKIPKSDGSVSWNATALAAIQAEMEENGASILDTLGDRILGTLAAGTHNAQSGDAYAIVNNGTYGNAALDTELGTLGTEVGKIPKSDGTASWNATALGAIQSEAEDALDAKGLDHLVSAAVTGTDITDNSIIAKLVSKSATADWDSFDNQSEALEALRDQGDSAWITAVGFSTHAAADVWSVGTRALTDKAGFSLAADQSGVTVGTVSTLTGHTVQTGDTYALANGANGFANIKSDTAAILDDTGTNGVLLTSGAIDSIWDQISSLGGSYSFELLLTRLYQMINNKMIVTESTGNVALRNLADSSDIATGNVQDLGSTTERAGLSWV